MKRLALAALAALPVLLVLPPAVARAQRIFLNPSDQYSNAVSGGGNEAQYANDNADRAAAKIAAAGFSTQVVEGLGAATDAANAWPADIYISIHTNAGGGHGTETWFYTGSSTGQTLAQDVQDGLLERFNAGNRGLKNNTTFYVLRNTNMPAVLTEIVFHDCTTSHEFPLGSMSESAFLRNGDGRDLMSSGIADGACTYYGATCPVAGCQPSPEVCNGEDEDCDGAPDNGDPGGGQPCDTGLPGVCAAGTTHCRSGAIACEAGSSGGVEVCNGLDDDCNGSPDDGDPGGGGACDTGRPGECAAGTLHCRGGSLACEANAGGAAEVCNGLDDDCSGVADDGDPGGGEACDTGAPGACAEGTTRCVDGSLTCVPATEPREERCDGVDDDCDGEVDEGACTDGGPSVDAGTPPADGGPAVTGPVEARGGCGCGAAGAGAVPLVPALGALGLLRRRRSR